MGKIAFVFSGQGAQYTGMGKSLYESSPAARAVFDMADSIRPGTSEQCFNASAEELSKTLNTQPCVFVCNLAAARAVEESGVKPDCVAGFSLGEIDALAFSGMLSDEEAFRLVCKRAQAMDNAAAQSRGAMAAVMKLPAAQIEEICASFDGVWPVNYNSPAQTVVAARAELMDEFAQKIKESKGRCVPLAVSGAFHSPLMHPAAEQLYEYMQGVDFKAPKIPIYSNVTAQPYSGDPKELIKSQAESPVRWQATVENMINEGVDRFIEVGVGKTLTGLIKKINPEVTATKVECPEDIEAL